MIRVIVAVLFILTGIFCSLIPIFPGTVLVLIGCVLLISGKKVTKLIKIRKGVVHLFRNLSWKCIKHKIKDFKTHIRHILEKEKK